MQKGGKNFTEAILSTKEGKQNSIIKVVNVKNAEIQKGEVSREDKIEVLLSGLLEDVKEIKEYGVSSRQQIRVQQTSDWKNIALNDGESASFEMMLKHGITNKDITRTMDDIKASMGIHIVCHRDRDRLSGIIYTDNLDKLHYIMGMLQRRLCE